MRFFGQRPDKKGETTLYDFTMGSQELVLIYNLLNANLRGIPKVTETEVVRGRLQNIVREFGLQVRANKIKL